MAVKKESAETDARHPDTVADSGRATPELDKEVYGFRTIEESDAPEGPGAVEPVRVDPVSSVPNSTFASRAGNGGVESKAVQSAENK
jgi:hypothetical protein